MTLLEEVQKKLEDFPEFRERKLRGQFLAKLALRACGLETGYKNGEVLSLQDLSDYAVKYDSYRHAWGDITRDVPNLRGTDYAEGEILAQAKQLELGYTPGYKQDLKIGARIMNEEVDLDTNKNNSNCCNAVMFGDRCSKCQESCISIAEEEMLTHEKRVEEAEQRERGW